MNAFAMLSSRYSLNPETLMPEGLIFLLIMIAVIVVYTIAKVLQLMRLSDKQWQEVDKSKLREWDDDDD